MSNYNSTINLKIKRHIIPEPLTLVWKKLAASEHFEAALSMYVNNYILSDVLLLGFS